MHMARADSVAVGEVSMQPRPERVPHRERVLRGGTRTVALHPQRHVDPARVAAQLHIADADLLSEVTAAGVQLDRMGDRERGFADLLVVAHHVDSDRFLIAQLSAVVLVQRRLAGRRGGARHPGALRAWYAD